MKVKFGLALLICLTLRIETRAQQIASANAAPAGMAEPATRQVPIPQGPAELRVQLGKSLLITSQQPLTRVSVTDPSVANAVIVSPTQVLIHGLKAGSETLLLWDSNDSARSFNLIVDLDIAALRDSIRQMFPNETLQVMQSGGSLVLSGNASSKAASDRAAALAATVSPTVVNLVTTTEGRQVVLLQVRFAEVDRSAMQDVAMTLFSTGATNTIGVLGTHQFDATVTNSGAIPAGVTSGSQVQAPNVVAGGIGRTAASTPSSFGLSDLLNIFLFRPDLNIGTAIKALEQRNILQILAEPNVMAINGTEASFLAGGEFPYPVVQGGANVGAVTVQFKEFGIRLSFTPQIMPDGVIRLKVSPEVSALDFADGLTISGFTVPSLTSRKAVTEVELQDGQSFAIAGLIDNRLTEIAQKVPVLGNLPILGPFFRSHAQNKTNTELLVMITPKLVQPQAPGQAAPLPEFPKPFLEPHKFDGKSNETPSQNNPGVKP
jgi:pilus assembly protein CpaC